MKRHRGIKPPTNSDSLKIETGDDDSEALLSEPVPVMYELEENECFFCLDPLEFSTLQELEACNHCLAVIHSECSVGWAKKNSACARCENPYVAKPIESMEDVQGGRIIRKK